MCDINITKETKFTVLSQKESTSTQIYKKTISQINHAVKLKSHIYSEIEKLLESVCSGNDKYLFEGEFLRNKPLYGKIVVYLWEQQAKIDLLDLKNNLQEISNALLTEYCNWVRSLPRRMTLLEIASNDIEGMKYVNQYWGKDKIDIEKESNVNNIGGGVNADTRVTRFTIYISCNKNKE